MGKLAWFGIGIVALVAALAAASLGAVHYVQNNDMRAWAAYGAQQAGVAVTFGGPVTIKLWPQLVIKAQNIEVASLQGPGSLAKLDAVAVQAAWGSGLRPWQGIQLRAVEAKNPTITLTKSAQGVANWVAAATSATTATSTDAAAATAANPLATLTQQGGVLASVRLAIANLNLTYADAQSGQKVVVKNMNIGANTQGTVATTTLKGSVNGQGLEGKLVADVANMADIPVKGRLEGAGAALALEGRVTEQQAAEYGFSGLINARSGDVRGTLQTLLGKAPPQAPNSPAALTGDVVLSSSRVVLRNFSARLGELLQARGDIDVQLTGTPSGKGTLAVQGSNLRTLAELLGGTKQPTLPAKPFNLQAKLAGEKSIEVRDLVFNIEPVLRATGTITITPQSGAQPDLNTALNIESPNLQALLQAFGQTQTAPNQALQATLNVQGSGGRYTLNSVKAQLADLATMAATGTINASGKVPVLDVQAELQGTNMAKAAAGFGVGGSLPTSGFSLRAKVRGSGPYEMEGLTINLPGLVQALANLTYTAGAPANLVGDINISQLAATRLGYCGSGNGGGGGASGAGGAGGSSAAATSSAPWSDEPLGLEALRGIAFNLKLKASGISCADVPLERLSATLRNTPSQLDITGLEAGLANNGGTLTGSLSLSHAGTPKLNTNLKLNNLVTEQLVPALASKGVRLPLSGAIELASLGNSTRALAQNLGGRVALGAENGQLPYTQMLGNVVALERLLQGQAGLPSNGDGSIDKLAMVLVLRQGAGTFEALQVNTGNGAMQLTGAGGLDLPNWTIDLTLTPKLATSSGLAIPLLVRGPLTAPAIGADPAFTQKLTQRLATEGLKSALGLDKESAKGLGGVVTDVLGGKGLTEEGVGNLLNQFIKPKAAAPVAPAAPATPAAPVVVPTAPATIAPVAPVNQPVAVPAAAVAPATPAAAVAATPAAAPAMPAAAPEATPTTTPTPEPTPAAAASVAPVAAAPEPTAATPTTTP